MAEQGGAECLMPARSPRASASAQALHARSTVPCWDPATMDYLGELPACSAEAVGSASKLHCIELPRRF